MNKMQLDFNELNALTKLHIKLLQFVAIPLLWNRSIVF
jgi:hypothetical protein